MVSQLTGGRGQTTWLPWAIEVHCVCIGSIQHRLIVCRIFSSLLAVFCTGVYFSRR